MIAYHGSHPSKIKAIVNALPEPTGVYDIIELCEGTMSQNEARFIYSNYLSKLNKLAKDGTIVKYVYRDKNGNRYVKFGAVA